MKIWVIFEAKFVYETKNAHIVLVVWSKNLGFKAFMELNIENAIIVLAFGVANFGIMALWNWPLVNSDKFDYLERPAMAAKIFAKLMSFPRLI